MRAPISRDQIRSAQKNALLILLSYAGVYYALLFVLNPHNTVIASDLMSPLGFIISLVIMFQVLKLYGSHPAKKIWMLFFLGTAVFLLGDIQWGYNELVRGGGIPFPSSSDPYYTVSAVLMLIAFFLHIPQKSKFAATRSGFDVLIVMAIYLTLEAKYILEPIMSNMALSNVEKFASLMYPLFDAGFFVCILLLYFNDAREGEYFKSKWMILIAATWLLIDQTYSIQTILGIYQSGSWLDPLWAASNIGLSIVAWQSLAFHLYPPEVVPVDVSSDLSVNSLKTRLVFTYTSLVVFMAIWGYNFYQTEPLAIGGLVIIMLVILRQFFALLENQRLMRLVQQSNQDLIDANVRIEYELKTDYLTRLFNRRYIDGALAAIKTGEGFPVERLSVMIMDLDHFKSINDQYGHSSGDQVLKQVAEIIKNTTRREDIAGRWGGEEFIVLLPDADIEVARSIGERIRTEIESYAFRIDANPTPIHLSVSIGVSQYMPVESDFDKVLLRADQGMYEAKFAGRNRLVVKTHLEASH